MNKHHQAISITDIWYNTWKIFSGHFLKFLFVTSLPIIISYLFLWSVEGSFVFSVKTLPDPSKIFSPTSGFIYFTIIAFIIILICEIWGTIALVLTTINHKHIKLSEIFYKSLEFFWPVIVLSVLSLLITTLGLIIGYFFVFLVSLIVGLLSLQFLNNYFGYIDLIPLLFSLLISMFLIFAPFFLIDEKIKPTLAIRKSYRIIKSFFWPFIIRIILIYAVITTVSFLLNFIPYAGQALAIFLSAPLLSIYLYNMYMDFKPKA